METNLPLEPDGLEEKINYRFKNRELLYLALTHSSYSNESGIRKHHLYCNERLEFLGDSVLSLIVSQELYAKYPGLSEGELTRMRAETVCEHALSKYAVAIGLGQYLRLGIGEEKTHGRERKSILADAFEALIAAVYTDSGSDGMRNVGEFLKPFIAGELRSINAEGNTFDCKTALQQFVQQTEGDFLEYIEIKESGPDHMKRFEVEARLNSNVIGRGSGKSKKEAEQNAAKAALELFGVI